MEEGGPGEPRHEGGVLDRVPGPEAAPSELYIGPLGAEHDAHREEVPGDERPAAGGHNPSVGQLARDEGGHAESVGNRKANETHIEGRWVEGHTGTLENWIEALAVGRRRHSKPQWVGEQEHDGEEEEAVYEQGRYGVGREVGVALPVDDDDERREYAKQKLPEQDASVERAPEGRELIHRRLGQARDGGDVLDPEVARKKRVP